MAMTMGRNGPEPIRADWAIPVKAWQTYENLFNPETKLPGWILLLDRTNVALTRAARNGSQVLVAVMHDPHAFSGRRAEMKEITDSLRAALRRDDTLAHVERNVLVAVCNDVGADADAAQVARRLVSRAHVRCNLGIALSRGHDDPRSLLDQVVRDALIQARAGSTTSTGVARA
jgi:hypothetical protein